jgi:tetratricopeptide (TPR) repeat protein
MTVPLDKVLVSPILVGRDRELEALDVVIDHACAGEGQTLMIAGEAGIGKSRLIAEARRQFETQTSSGGVLLQGNCFEVDRDYPFAPITDLLRRWSALRSDAERNATGSELVALFPELAGQWVRPSPTPTLRLNQEKRWIFRALGHVLTDIASAQRLLIVIEDLHWADEATLEFLPYLVRVMSDYPALLLLSYRSDEAHPSLRHMLATMDRERLTSELTLQRLQPRDVDRLIRAVLRQSHPIRADFLDMIHRLTDGNPFFIEEVLRSLIAAGDIYYSDGHWHRKEAHELRVPRSVHDAVWRRASGLSSAAHEVLGLAAVSGRHFDLRVVQELTGRDEPSLLACIRELTERQLIYEESAEHFSFRHALTREAIYTELLGRERQRLHLAVAETIERLAQGSTDHHAGDLAYHFEEAAVWAKALGYAIQAGERAESLFAPQAAADHFTRALRAAEQASVRLGPTLYRKRGLAYATLGQYDLAHRDFETMLELVRAKRDRYLEWEALLDLGGLWTGREYDRAGAFFQQAFDLARDMGEPPAVARSLLQLGNWQANVERVDEARESLTMALAMFEDLNDQPGRAEALDLLGVVADASGDLRQMTEYYGQASQLYQALDDRKGFVSAYANVAAAAGGYTLFETISLRGGVTVPEAEAAGERVVRLARDIDWRSGESYALFSLAAHYYGQGSYDLALDLGRECLEAAEEIEHHEWMVAGRLVVGSLYSDLLVQRRASELFAQGVAVAQECGSLWMQRLTTGYLASSRILEGNLDEAGALLRDVDDHLPMKTMGLRLLWSARAKLALALGDADTALEIIDRLFACARNLTAEHDIPALAKLRGECLTALGRYDEAEASLKSALSGATMYGLRPLRWRVHLTLGNLHRTMGREQETMAELAEARAIVESLAASVPDEPLRGQFHSRAIAMFPPYRQPGDKLTSREREVAELLAKGMSNRAIADALFIGERTVETHVSNILAKLEFSSRTQVADWVTEYRLNTAADQP